MKLTDDQQRALDELLEWRKSDSLFICIKGSAGTGKTTLVKFFLENLRLLARRTALSAPTHKAKDVLASKVSGFQAHTIHKLLGIAMNTDITDFDPNDPLFEVLNPPMIRDYSMVILDEASMVNVQLYDYLIDIASREKIKVVFLGDELQLNPVNETISPVFKRNRVIELKQVIRQSGDNPLLDFFNVLRQDIMDGTEKYLELLKENNINDSGGYRVFDKDTQGDEFKRLLFLSMKTDPDAKFMAWHRNVVSAWNTAIKNAVRPSDDVLAVGDVITASKNYRVGRHMVLSNGTDYTVISTKPKTVKVAKRELNVVQVELEDPLGGIETFKVIQPESLPLFGHIVLEKQLNAKSRGGGHHWKYYFDFRSSYLIGTDLISNQGKIDTCDYF